MKKRSKRANRKRRYRRNEGESAPAVIKTSELTELAYTVGAGLGGYAATRFVARVAYTQAVKRGMKAAKHIGAGASAVAAVAAFFTSRHWDKLEEHHEAITIGAGIGAAQTVLQTYLPQYAWIVSDVKPEDAVVSESAIQKMLRENDLEEVPLRSSSAPAQIKAAEVSVEELAGDLAPEWAFGDD